MRHWSKRMVGIAVSAVMAGGVLAGCGSSGNNTTQNAPGGSGGSKPYAGQTISVVFANHPWATAIQALLPEFESETGIKVKVQSYFETQLSQKLSVSLTAGSSEPDVFMYRPLQEGRQFYTNGWLQPLDTYVTKDANWNWDDFSKSSVGTVMVNGHVSGVPIVTEQEILYYRKDLLQKAGLQPPTTIDEMVADAQKMNDPQHGIYGFVARGQRSAAITQESSFLYSYGGDWDQNGKATVNSPEAIQAFTTYGNLLKNYGPPGVLNMSWPQAAAIFAQGKAAMYTDASSIYPNLVDPSKSTVGDKIGFAVFPAGPAGAKPYAVTSWGLTMNSKSQHKDAAWAFIQWATSQDTVLKTQEKGNPGARNSVWASPEGVSGMPKDLVPIIEKSAEIGTNHDRPTVVKVDQARDIIGNIVQSVIQGQDAKAAADKAEQDYQALLDQDKK